MPLRVVVVAVVVELVFASAASRPTTWLEIVLTPRARARAKAEDEVATEEQAEEQEVDIIHNKVVVVEESLVAEEKVVAKVVAEQKASTTFKNKILQDKLAKTRRSLVTSMQEKKSGMRKNLLIRTTSSWNRTTAWAEVLEKMFGFSESLLRLVSILMDLMYRT